MREVRVSVGGVAERRGRGPEKEINPELRRKLTLQEQARTRREPMLENSNRADVGVERQVKRNCCPRIQGKSPT